MTVKRGEIYMISLGSGNRQGSEQQGDRPCVIIQNNIGNTYSTTTIVALLTAEDKRTKRGETYPMHVVLHTSDVLPYGIDEISTVLCEQVQTVDMARLQKKIGYIDPKSSKYAELGAAIRVSMGT